MSAQSSSYPAGWLEVDHGSRVMAAVSFILVFTTILLALRLYARSLTSASRGWDEFLLVPSYLCLLGLLVCLYLDVIKGGLGRHGAAVEQEDPQKLMTFLELLYVLDWFYVPSNAMSRISVVALYLRFFTQPLYRAACWGVIAFLLGNMIATIIAAQVECFPLQFTWDKTIRGGHCFNLILWYKLTNLPTVISDVMVMALPVPTVWGLQASFSCKAGIATVFLTGSIGGGGGSISVGSLSRAPILLQYQSRGGPRCSRRPYASLSTPGDLAASRDELQDSGERTSVLTTVVKVDSTPSESELADRLAEREPGDIRVQTRFEVLSEPNF